MTALEELRGYKSAIYAGEAASVKWMLTQDYSMQDILACYTHLKSEHFWADKSLTMMSVKGQIGEWKAWEGKERPKANVPVHRTYGRPEIIADYKQFPEKF